MKLSHNIAHLMQGSPFASETLILQIFVCTLTLRLSTLGGGSFQLSCGHCGLKIFLQPLYKKCVQ
jgi:hypothetical protein